MSGIKMEQSIIRLVGGANVADQEDFKLFYAEGEEHIYTPTEWIFHESTPRQWAGVILEGEVEFI